MSPPPPTIALDERFDKLNFFFHPGLCLNSDYYYIDVYIYI